MIDNNEALAEHIAELAAEAHSEGYKLGWVNHKNGGSYYNDGKQYYYDICLKKIKEQTS